MKSLICIFGLTFLLFACDSSKIKPKEIIGEWANAYQIQTKNADGKWGPWSYVTIYVALPNIEFTRDGKFLRGGQPGADCCSAGNLYTISNNVIKFSDFLSCPQVRCMDCHEWTINTLKDDTLILESCNTRTKYIKAK
ncbi:hypothetical protein [Emticicia soli]|uniref:Lipocalin-like domain-containing protein n=1 Tax=Emticicia soli TaxID=2027878 RepID=A0ABW5J6A9_9BACT